MAAEHDTALTSQEIWDDSALVDSWNSALEEYKKYHSIHTKGGDVTELLKARKPDTDNHTPDDEAAESIQDKPMHSGVLPTETAPANDEQLEDETNGKTRSTDAPILAPDMILGTVHDENLKKLLMSWYYAGYYTGLHEGQRTQNGHGQG